jgi:hypothetical protein
MHMWEKTRQNLGYFKHFQKTAHNKNCPIGENSPNPVTLFSIHTYIHTYVFLGNAAIT